MKIVIKFAFIFLLLSICACQPQKEPGTRKTALARGFKMIDQAHYDAAIAYFTNLVQQDSHYHVKLALASAYAGRAGVQADKIYSFVKPSEALPNNLFDVTGTLEQRASELMKSFSLILNQWQRIPTASEAARKDLQRAVQVLEGVEVPGGHLYSATLRIVLLKSWVSQGLQNWDSLQTKQNCSPDLLAFYKWGVRILEELRLFLEDLKGAYPQEHDHYEVLEKSLQKIIREAQVPAEWKADLCN